MSNTTITTGASGIGFCGLLTIVFITLKLCGIIAWKWVWVFSPLWIGAAILLAIVIFALLIAHFIMWLINRR